MILVITIMTITTCQGSLICSSDSEANHFWFNKPTKYWNSRTYLLTNWISAWNYARFLEQGKIKNEIIIEPWYFPLKSKVGKGFWTRVYGDPGFTISTSHLKWDAKLCLHVHFTRVPSSDSWNGLASKMLGAIRWGSSHHIKR